FFQAEDGIRDRNVTGVQTCALPIYPDGIVQAFEVLTPPVGRNVSEALRQIQAYQHVRKHKGAEVTPSGWQPGKKTLKPSPDLVRSEERRVGKEWRSRQSTSERREKE